MMPKKPKTPQKEDLVGLSGRDQFQTPNYATDIIIPYLHAKKFFSEKGFKIWECASGLGKIEKRLSDKGFDVFGTDLQTGVNFLTAEPPQWLDCIVTNPPFSLKKKFYERALGYGVPFALLIPADYSTWVIQAIKDGAEKIIPTRRIDYVTPDILTRIHEGEVWETVKNEFPYSAWGLQKSKELPGVWDSIYDRHKELRDFCKWNSIYDAPAAFLKKYSSCQFHSMWLTKGFGLGRTETFVDLTNADKLNI